MTLPRHPPSKTRPKASEPAEVGARAFKRQRQRAQARNQRRARRKSVRRSVGTWPAIDLRAWLAGIPSAGRICFLIAFLNAACWSILIPPLQVPDEPDHVAYVQELAQASQLPSAATPEEFSAQEIAALNGLRQGLVRFKPQLPSLSSLAEQRELESDLDAPAPSPGALNAGTAAGEPPLFYALQTVPYTIGRAGNLLDSVQLMRLLSAVIGAIAALFIFFFIREVLSGSVWASTAGALAVALLPLLGFISGGVNPEVLLTADTAALFYLLARAFRRGMTVPIAAAIGVGTAVGFLTKLNFLGLVPGILCGLAVLTARVRQEDPRRALRCLGAALGIGFAPVALYTLVNMLSGHTPLGEAGTIRDVLNGSLPRALSYTWQLYLPRLPGMHSYFPGILTTKHLWFDGFVGLYGWVDTLFPQWVYDAALMPAAAIALLATRELVLGRASLRSRVAEPLVYGVMAIGLMMIVGATSFISQTLGHTGPYWEPRYFLPLIPLFGLVLALGARAAGRRWGPVVAVLIVGLFFAHDVFSQLQVIARYYA